LVLADDLLAGEIHGDRAVAAGAVGRSVCRGGEADERGDARGFIEEPSVATELCGAVEKGGVACDSADAGEEIGDAVIGAIGGLVEGSREAHLLDVAGPRVVEEGEYGGRGTGGGARRDHGNVAGVVDGRTIQGEIANARISRRYGNCGGKSESAGGVCRGVVDPGGGLGEAGGARILVGVAEGDAGSVHVLGGAGLVASAKVDAAGESYLDGGVRVFVVEPGIGAGAAFAIGAVAEGIAVGDSSGLAAGIKDDGIAVLVAAPSSRSVGVDVDRIGEADAVGGAGGVVVVPGGLVGGEGLVVGVADGISGRAKEADGAGGESELLFGDGRRGEADERNVARRIIVKPGIDFLAKPSDTRGAAGGADDVAFKIVGGNGAGVAAIIEGVCGIGETEGLNFVFGGVGGRGGHGKGKCGDEIMSAEVMALRRDASLHDVLPTVVA
jgi:hypothetical protein